MNFFTRVSFNVPNQNDIFQDSFLYHLLYLGNTRALSIMVFGGEQIKGKFYVPSEFPFIKVVHTQNLKACQIHSFKNMNGFNFIVLVWVTHECEFLWGKK